MRMPIADGFFFIGLLFFPSLAILPSIGTRDNEYNMSLTTQMQKNKNAGMFWAFEDTLLFPFSALIHLLIIVSV